jgi:DNA modification methylase
MNYAAFLASKRREWAGCGIDPRPLPSLLFPFQQVLTRWALRKGKACLWADTGLGKTLMQVAWADQIPGKVLIVAPLCVGMQTRREALKLGIPVTGCAQTATEPDLLGVSQASGHIEMTNYERLHHVDPARYTGIVLDESSILKSVDGVTRGRLIEMFADTPYKLCCTATPAPNDIAELANHCEFLGIMTRTEMLATFFVHDQDGWRLKGHATHAFYRWLVSWGLFLRKPSDLGFADEGYDLPPLRVHQVTVGRSAPESRSTLYPGMADGLKGRLRIRQATIAEKVEAAVSIARSSPTPCIIWCGLNTEQEALRRALPEAVSVQGSDSEDDKESRLLAFIRGEAPILITKVRIAGFGLNLQHCARMIFVGIGDSYEQYYQAIRRCYRFGQQHPVEVSILVSEDEVTVVENVQRKEADAAAMAQDLIAHMVALEREEVGMTAKQTEQIIRRVATGERWTLHNGDCVDVMAELPDTSVDLSVFSPPFIALFTYTNSERDIGNCSDRVEFLAHFRFAVEQLYRLTKPGRLCCVHLAQVASTMVTHGVIGLIDLRGKVTDLFLEQGWVYHGDITIDKDPQAQAIRTHSKALLFVQLKKDSSWLRPALADYILVFRKPGENAVAIHPDISNEDWIEWARPIWYGIRESDTLNVREATGDADERHVCALQLSTIERCVRLWSNKGETVLSPFAGIGSEGFVAVQRNRRYIGIELKPEYYDTAIKNLKRAEVESIDQHSLFPDVVA